MSAEAPPVVTARSSAIRKATPDKTLIVACGALAREITALITTQGWSRIAVTCLPASLHNQPRQIAGRLRTVILAAEGRYRRVMVAYGDCGSGGAINAVLAETGAERIGGPHCYAFYAGATDFDALMEEEPGSFFLTDYLARQFDALILRGLGLDRHPELLSDYFGNYRRLVYLAQTDDAGLTEAAQGAADRLGLAFERRFTGYGGLAGFLARAAE